MKKRAVLIAAGIIAVICAACICLFMNNGGYCSDYFKGIGISDAAGYEEAESVLGIPNEKIDGNRGSRWKYDDMELYFYDDTVQSAWVMSEDYKFGKKAVAVGDDRKKIAAVYKGAEPYTGVAENELAYSDGGYYVVFYFDKDDKVSQIDFAKEND